MLNESHITTIDPLGSNTGGHAVKEQQETFECFYHPTE